MTNHITATDLERLKFRKIGEFKHGKRNPSNDIKITERVSLCYIMIVDNLVMYVGKSKQGYS